MNAETRAMLVSENELIEMLRAEIPSRGLRKWSRANDIHHGVVSRVLRHERPLGHYLASILGYKREVMWKERQP